MSRLVHEFREFAIKGNAIDIAIGLIIGAAFTKVVNSLVQDILMPPLGFLMGGIDLSDYALIIHKGVGDDVLVSITYGAFINAIINFLIVSVAIFALVKGMNKFRKNEDEKPPITQLCPECLMEIPLEARRCCHCTSTIPF